MLVNQHFDLRPKGIIQMLDLLRPIYEKTAAYGHFGREEPEFTWETNRQSCGPEGRSRPVSPPRAPRAVRPCFRRRLTWQSQVKGP